MKVLITGASGFIGQNLLPYLLLYGIDTENISLRNNWEEHIDFTDIHAVIHLAGLAHDHKKIYKEQDFFSTNYELTKKLFSCFEKSNVHTFIHISSIAAVNESSIDSILTEDYNCNPQTPYGKSKLAAEKYLLEKTTHFKKVVILRPTMIHGPGDKGNLRLLYNIVYNGIPYPLASFKNQRSFLSIENLCFVIKEILAHPTIPSGIYNVADDEPVSTNQLVKIIGQTINKKSRLLPIPKRLIQSLAKLGDFTPFPLNSERLKKLTENYVVSNSKIKAALGIEAMPVSAEEGLRKTISSFMTE